MKIEHYNYIRARFLLGPLCESGNNIQDLNVQQLSVLATVYSYKVGKNWWDSSTVLFVNIPSRELAEKIVTFIKETEVMFI